MDARLSSRIWPLPLLFIAACAGRVQGEPRSAAEGGERFTFKDPPAEYYTTDFEKAGGADRPVAGVPTDARLDRAAASIGSISASGLPVTARAVREALWWHGVPEVSQDLAVYSDSSPDRLAASVKDWLAKKASAGSNRFGLSVREIPGGTEAVALAIQSLVSLDKLPRSLERIGETLRIAGSLAPFLSGARIVAVAPDGVLVEPRIAANGGRFSAAFQADKAGSWQIGIMGNGPGGPVQVANFPVTVASRPGATIALAPAGLESRDPRALERRLFEAINRDRKKADVAPVQWSEALAKVARAYSAEMAKTGVVAHRSALSGTVVDRLAKAGIGLLGVSENLARALSADEAHEGLMGSPAHRANLLSPKATEVGIGVVLLETESPIPMLVTEIFALADR